MRTFVFFSLAFLAAASSAGATAAEWTLLSRQQALEQTRSDQPERRRLAYGRLAEVGTMDDVPVLLAALWDEEEMVRSMAEQSVWGIWMRTGDSVVDPLYQTGIQLINEEAPGAAIEKLDEVIAMKPDFAEAWNRRGDAWAALGDEARALADYDHAIRLNPYHFGTLESCGQIWLERRNYRKAADFFRRALDINPNLSGAGRILRELEKALENDRI